MKIRNVPYYYYCPYAICKWPGQYRRQKRKKYSTEQTHLTFFLPLSFCPELLPAFHICCIYSLDVLNEANFHLILIYQDAMECYSKVQFRKTFESKAVISTFYHMTSPLGGITPCNAIDKQLVVYRLSDIT